jgi:hypothetical protein
VAAETVGNPVPVQRPAELGSNPFTALQQSALLQVANDRDALTDQLTAVLDKAKLLQQSAEKTAESLSASRQNAGGGVLISPLQCR